MSRGDLADAACTQLCSSLLALSKRDHAAPSDDFSAAAFQMLIALLQAEESVARNAAETLYNLATEAGSSSDNAIREANGILPLVNLIAQRPNAASAHAAVLVLRELTSIDTPACRSNRVAIRNAGGIEVLVKQLNDPSNNHDPDRLAGVAGALWNLAAWHPDNSSAIAAADGAISGLSRVVRAAVQNQPGATKAARLSAAAEAATGITGSILGIIRASNIASLI